MFFFTKILTHFSVKVLHCTIERMVAFAKSVKRLSRTFCGELKFACILYINIQVYANFGHILIGTHEGEVPALLLLEAADEFVNLFASKLSGRILITIGDDSYRCDSALVLLHFRFEASE